MFILLDFVDSYNKLCNKNEWKNSSLMLDTFLTTNHVKQCTLWYNRAGNLIVCQLEEFSGTRANFQMCCKIKYIWIFIRHW